MAKKKKADRRLTTPMKGKLILVFGGIIFLFLILVVKLCYVTATKGKEYETAVLSQQKHDSTILPFERGKIYDRNGNILATNEKIYTLILEPQNILLQDKKYEEATINALHEYFGFSKSKLKKTIEDNPYSYYEVYKKNMTYDEVEKFQKFLDLADASAKGVSKAKKAKIESAKMVKGVSFEEDYKRVYPYNSLACRVLGYTSSGNVGNWGIEQYYNSQLNGVNGRAYYYFNEELDQEQSVKEPKNGNSVVSTIDMQIQKIIEQKLKDFDDKIGSKVTNILVMNPQNGEIYACVNVPEFDLNEPFELNSGMDAEGMSEEKKQDLLNQMWRNPCLNDTYEPGSTFKIITMSAGLEAGVVSVNDRFFCPGYKLVDDRRIHCARRTGHGSQSFVEGAQNSCNPVFIEVGLRLGVENYYHYFKKFGLLKKTGVDLPGEAGTIMHKMENMGNVELATVAFGQSFQITPIQLATTVSSLINGGRRITPHFGVSVLSSDGTNGRKLEYPVETGIISEKTSETVRGILEKVVSEGSGRNARIEGCTVGGKTATSQTLPRSANRYISSFLGFMPAEDPQILGICIIHDPQGVYYGGTIAAPVIKNIFEAVLERV